MSKLFGRKGKKIIGMIHLLPLPGAPGYRNLEEVEEAALRDAEALYNGGVDAFLVENYGDTPFFPDKVPSHTLTSFTRVAMKIKENFDLPLGVNVLRNDSLGALSIALAVGGDFIRVNVLSGVFATDQGIIQGKAHELLRLRRELGVEVEIFADVRVKHATPIGDFSLEEEVDNIVSRAMADAIIVTGRKTGVAPSIEELKTARAVAEKPLIVGSGLSLKNLSLLKNADGAIIGTWFKKDGKIHSPVDEERVKKLVEAVRNL